MLAAPRPVTQACSPQAVRAMPPRHPPAPRHPRPAGRATLPLVARQHLYAPGNSGEGPPSKKASSSLSAAPLWDRSLHRCLGFPPTMPTVVPSLAGRSSQRQGACCSPASPQAPRTQREGSMLTPRRRSLHHPTPALQPAASLSLPLLHGAVAQPCHRCVERRGLVAGPASVATHEPGWDAWHGHARGRGRHGLYFGP
jgi:hypothetical protein